MGGSLFGSSIVEDETVDHRRAGPARKKVDKGSGFLGRNSKASGIVSMTFQLESDLRVASSTEQLLVVSRAEDLGQLGLVCSYPVCWG